ncbi:hypothetical protein B0H19DRAFT_1270514 [Mycena capillaripes]|nr:hypothetical protein B0H19DRAFT_1270514 [Mycena capillaripes]
MHDCEYFLRLGKDLFKLLSGILPKYAEILMAHKAASDSMDVDPPPIAPAETGGATHESSDMDIDPPPPLRIILPPQMMVPSAPTMVPAKCALPGPPGMGSVSGVGCGSAVVGSVTETPAARASFFWALSLTVMLIRQAKVANALTAIISWLFVIFQFKTSYHENVSAGSSRRRSSDVFSSQRRLKRAIKLERLELLGTPIF